MELTWNIEYINGELFVHKDINFKDLCSSYWCNTTKSTTDAHTT